MRGMPHTVKVERHQNELIVHVALLHGPDARLPGGVLLHTEGWVDIGYGLKMFLVIGSGNIRILMQQRRVMDLMRHCSRYLDLCLRAKG